MRKVVGSPSFYIVFPESLCGSASTTRCLTTPLVLLLVEGQVALAPHPLLDNKVSNSRRALSLLLF